MTPERMMDRERMMDSVWPLALKARSKLVCLALAWRADEYGLGAIAVADLVALTGLTEKAIEAGLREAELRGIIRGTSSIPYGFVLAQRKVPS